MDFYEYLDNFYRWEWDRIAGFDSENEEETSPLNNNSILMRDLENENINKLFKSKVNKSLAVYPEKAKINSSILISKSCIIGLKNHEVSKESEEENMRKEKFKIIQKVPIIKNI